MITNHLPYPPISGAPLRNYNMLRRYSRLHEVWVASFRSSADDDANIGHLLEFCKGVETAATHPISGLANPLDFIKFLLSKKPPELRLYLSDELISKINRLIQEIDFDIIDIEDSFMGIYLEVLPAKLQKNTVLTFHDVVFSKYLRISKLEPKIARKLRTWFYSTTMRSWEPFYAEKFGRCIAVSDSDRQMLLAANPRLQIDVVPNGVDTNLYQPLPSNTEKPALLFVGDMAYRPNIDAINFFCQEIFPKIINVIPNIELWIVGINPPPEVKKFEAGNVHVTGKVDDVRPYYKRSSVCVVPLRAGGGTRLKILEAMALGRPVVSTAIGCEGLNVEDGKQLLIAETADQFVDKILTLFLNENLRNSIACQARELVVNCYDWDVIANSAMNIFSKLTR
ncbi:MAG: glycosyltransferase [Anaerolineaceae bacterium]|nr:glycosyltransferase [Anaerolineaceae bacterium]